jgi:hypothetical protein
VKINVYTNANLNGLPNPALSEDIAIYTKIARKFVWSQKSVIMTQMGTSTITGLKYEKRPSMSQKSSRTIITKLKVVLIA